MRKKDETFRKSWFTKNKIHSSSSSQGVFLISGFRWLCHLSLHCFPMRSGKCCAIKVHFWGPFIWTSFISCMSSSSDQGSKSCPKYREVSNHKLDWPEKRLSTFFTLRSCFLASGVFLVSNVDILRTFFGEVGRKFFEAFYLFVGNELLEKLVFLIGPPAL